ncbi:MAG: DUF2723 domain-containing protein [Balneolaceae bacterium]|nr:DUF2723 domain-containing protein [Balneolaceae bacterium]
MTFAVTDTFWFSAVEAEVYAVSMFFTSAVVWMALKWSEYSERWLVLIAYMFGLALGVHLLNLLALFFVALIVYFKKKDFTLLSMSAAAVISVVSFLLIYPFTVQMLPSILNNITRASYGLIGPIFLYHSDIWWAWHTAFITPTRVKTASPTLCCSAIQ